MASIVMCLTGLKNPTSIDIGIAIGIKKTAKKAFVHIKLLLQGNTFHLVRIIVQGNQGMTIFNLTTLLI